METLSRSFKQPEPINKLETGLRRIPLLGQLIISLMHLFTQSESRHSGIGYYDLVVKHMRVKSGRGTS